VAESRARIGDLLRLLARHGVEHVVVGGVGSVLQGAPILTRDLDIVHSRSPQNIRRLLAALAEVHAFYRTRTDRRFEPGESELAAPGHQLLSTDLGDLDVRGTIGAGRSYDDIRGRAVRFELSGTPVMVLDLAAIIELKEALGREKDRAMLPLLRQVLAARDKPARERGAGRGLSIRQRPRSTKASFAACSSASAETGAPTAPCIHTSGASRPWRHIRSISSARLFPRMYASICAVMMNPSG
jgi:hypothetical protein